MPDRRDLPRVLTRSELASYGLTDEVPRWELARRRWTLLAPGVYATVTEPNDDDWLRGGLLHAGKESVISGEWALRRLGFRTARPTRTIRILIPYGLGVRSCPPFALRRTPWMPSVTVRDDLRLASPARSVVDAALERHSLNDVRALVSEAVQLGHCRPSHLDDALRQAPRRGSRLTRIAIAEVTGGSRSAPEARAAALLRRNGIRDFVQNVPVLGGRYIADFLWADLMAILEIDGAEFHFSRADWRSTLDRDAHLQGAGYAVLHAPPSLVANEVMFIRRIGDWLAARSAMITRNSGL